MMKIYQVSGEILAPVHIGTSHVWEPLEYFIDSSKNLLHLFSTEEILTSMDDAETQRFYELTEGENLNSLRNFIVEKAKSQFGSEQNDGIMVTPAVSHLYDEKLDDIRNQLLIQPMTRMASNERAFIPGSSIKGAIRTAVVSALAKDSRLPKPNPFSREVWEFESKVLNYRDAKADPFRTIKFADAFLDEYATFISQIFNVGKDSEGKLKQTGIQLIHEVTHSLISSTAYQRGCQFETELRLDDDLMNERSAVSQKFAVAQIVDWCNSFYKDKLEMEHTKFYDGTYVAEFSRTLLSQAFERDECLIRVGRFSGVESVTLDEYRDPQPPGRDKSWGNSRNIADGRFPMGWVKLKFAQ